MAGALIHLDTNILIFAADPGHPVREALRQWRGQSARFAVSAMTWAEFRCGPVTPALLRTWEKILTKGIAPVDRHTADLAAELFNLSGRRSRSLPDCLIAACTIQAGAQLATLNRADFAPLLEHGLTLINNVSDNPRQVR